MIIIYCGGIGSGKTISAVKEAYERSDYNEAYTNFSTKKIPNCKRIQLDWIIREDQAETKTGKITTKKVVNWDFWNDIKKRGKRFSIYLDEAHNILHSRMS